MDESLELKKNKRRMVELFVEKQLTLLARDAAILAIETMGTGKYVPPDTEPWARKIIAIVKEHSI